MRITNPFTGNSFCPTGAGGGIDPTCSPGTSGIARQGPPRIQLRADKYQSTKEGERRLEEKYFQFTARHDDVEANHGKSEIAQALSSEGSRRVVLYDKFDDVVGAVSFGKTEGDAAHPNWLTIAHLGSTGEVSGTGTELVRHVVTAAAKSKTGVIFESTPNAMSFYKKLGFVGLDASQPKIMGADPTRVLEIKRALGSPGRSK